MKLTRRTFCASGLACSFNARPSFAAAPLEIGWDDLVPPGVPYAEIIGEGEMDVENDTWNPIFDSNATRLNEDLDGALVRLPGFVIPFEMDSEGVTEFILAPYAGACIHVPPPPANQLIFVNTVEPWPNSGFWLPVWVVGKMSTQLQSTDLAEIGYALEAQSIDLYEW